MGNSNSNFQIIEQTSELLKIQWIPDRKTIIFRRGKRAQDSEILNDRDFFYYTLFRVLELYTWRYMNRKSILKTSSENADSISSPLSSDPDIYAPPKLPVVSSSPRIGFDMIKGSPKSDSPRLNAVDNVMNNVRELRNSSTAISPRNNYPIYKDGNKYSSKLSAEIIEVAILIIRQYVDSLDVGQALLAINTYIINLEADNIIHFINYRPNYECNLSIELCYKLNFYTGWLSLSHSFLYPHEWKFLMDQGLVLFDYLHDGTRNGLGSSSSPRYLDLLLETEKRIEQNQIATNPALPIYTESELLDNFNRGSTIHEKNQLDTYLRKLLCHINNYNTIVMKTLINWNATFNQ
jgi:hypothetical protein